MLGIVILDLHSGPLPSLSQPYSIVLQEKIPMKSTAVHKAVCIHLPLTSIYIISYGGNSPLYIATLCLKFSGP